MAISVLDRARKYFYRKDYNAVITQLEPNVIQYRDSFSFYYLLGLSCLYTGDIGGATSYFQRARQIKLRDPDLLVAQAALFLRRGDTHQAVEYYLEALEFDPSHRAARRSLDFIRKRGDPDTIAALVESGKIERFYPRLRRKPRVAPILLGIAAVGAIGFGAYFVLARTASSRGAHRADLSSFALASTDRAKPVETGGAYRYILTESQVLGAYGSAQRLFSDYRDNAAQVEINRILNSNASLAIRQKARLLMDYLGDQSFDSIKDRYSFADVTDDPVLYQDCWVVWKGMATNVRETPNSVDFEFLVGYDTRSSLEGIVPIHFDTYLAVDTSRPLEVLATVSVIQGKLSLVGKAIYQSAKPIE